MGEGAAFDTDSGQRESDDRFSVLGIPLAAVTETDLTRLAFERRSTGGARVFGHLNLHGLYLAERYPLMRAFYSECTLVHADGMPIVWIGRASGYPLRARHRVTYVDWLPRLLTRASEREASIFFLGGRPEVGPSAEARISQEYPGVRFESHHGYIRTKEEHAFVLQKILEFEPDVLLVGMGMPLQEDWILSNLKALPECTVLPCGACFDYFTGLNPTPPRILGKIGLEWAFRLASEPRRLWRRYLLEPLALAPALIRALSGGRDRR